MQNKTAALLTRLTQKNVKFVWFGTCEESFQKVKECLTTAPVLTLLTSGGGYIVYCVAPRVGLGSFLIQNSRMVAYAS